MNTLKSGWATLVTEHADRRSHALDHRRIERELASFVTEAEKAELSAMLERNADELDAETYGLISDQVVATTAHAA